LAHVVIVCQIDAPASAFTNVSALSSLACGIQSAAAVLRSPGAYLKSAIEIRLVVPPRTIGPC
jgi:hypothetical protein